MRARGKKFRQGAEVAGYMRTEVGVEEIDEGERTAKGRTVVALNGGKGKIGSPHAPPSHVLCYVV